MIAKDKINCFQLGATMPPREHLAISGDTLGCQNLGERVATGYCVEAKDVANHLTIHGFHNRELLVQNVNCTNSEKLCCRSSGPSLNYWYLPTHSLFSKNFK